MKKLTIGMLLTASLMCGCNGEKKTLYVWNWSDYIDQGFIERFEKKYECNVIVDSFDSNEAMYSKLKVSSCNYDIVFPSSYQIDMMVNDGLIEQLDRSKIPNVIENFDHSYDKQILDPSFEYSVPYIVTYTGFLVAKDKVGEIEHSWKILSDERFKGRITLLEDIREVIGAGLMYNGFSINSTNSNEIEIATKTVVKWKDNIRKFDSESYRTEVPDKSSWIGHGYSSDSSQAIMGDSEDSKRRDDMEFILPKEGFCIAWDEMVILKTSENKDLAHCFINELFDVQASIDNMKYVCGIMPNKKAIENIDEDMKKLLMFPEDVMRNGQVLRSFVGNQSVNDMYNEAWDNIKSTKR